MGPAIKGAIGKNQEFRVFTASRRAFFALGYVAYCKRRIAGHLTDMCYDHESGREFRCGLY
jgi:hypothetical protein